ncbi:MAG TPA: glycosyltransferase family 39 protein, partial [Patescibacteria group bacterium]|nr:glycosyltransferase family 39 protein [Patescibacteria group bacterium]
MGAPEKAIPAATGSRRWVGEVAVTILLIGASLLLFFYRLDSLFLFDADEPAYAEAAKEMLISGDWITPHFNFQPRFDKPILFYWLIALAYKGFGIGEYAARFWSAAFATGLTLSIYRFGRQLLGQRGACIAALAFATNVGTVVLARAAVTDMTLALCMAWTLFCFFDVYLATDKTREHLLFGGYLAMALAVLTKGPIGLLLPGLIIGLFLVIRRKARVTISRLRLLPGIGLFAVIALPWYLLVLRENGWAFIQGFFVQHHLNRYLGVVSSHVGSPLYFLPVVVLGFLPWSTTLSNAFGRLWTFRSRLRAELTGRQELLLFLWLWCGVVVLFFSFSRTKLPSYIF